MKINDLKIKKADKSDFGGIADCWKTVRGEKYYGEDVFGFEFLPGTPLFTAYDGDKIIGAVAATDGFFDNDKNIMSMLAVKKEYSGLGVATALIKKDEEYLLGAHTVSIKAHVVTVHNHAQRILERYGYIPTAVMPGVRDSANEPQADSQSMNKRALIIYVKPNIKTDAGVLFVPECLKAFSKRVYDSLDVSYTVKSNGSETDESKLKIHRDAHNGVIYIQALECGTDMDDKLLFYKSECAYLQRGTLILLINLNNASAVYGFYTATEQGFRFGGFDPLCSNGEFAVMYYGNKESIILSEIKTTENSKQIINEVLKIEK